MKFLLTALFVASRIHTLPSLKVETMATPIELLFAVFFGLGLAKVIDYVRTKIMIYQIAQKSVSNSKFDYRTYMEESTKRIADLIVNRIEVLIEKLKMKSAK